MWIIGIMDIAIIIEMKDTMGTGTMTTAGIIPVQKTVGIGTIMMKTQFQNDMPRR